MRMRSQELQQQFDPRQYPNVKPSRPRGNKTLRICPTCKKPGYIYLLDRNGTKFIYYIHYNEPPIGLTILRGRPIGFRYRRCTRDGRTYNTVEEALSEAKQELSDTRLKTDSQRLLMEKTQTEERKFRTRATQSIQVKSVQKVRSKGKNIECPKCHRNGVLNVAKRDPDPEKITFYVRHEKLGGALWGREHKVDRIKRHYIGRLNLQHVKSPLREYQMEDTIKESKLMRKGLDKYIEPERKAHPTVTREIHGKKTNSIKNIECPRCGELGTLRPFDGGRFYIGHGSDARKRHTISTSNKEHMAYCREQVRKHQEELITEN